MSDKVLRKNPNQKRKRSNRYQIRILTERCKGCQFCIEFCPRQVLHESTEVNSKGYRLPCADDNNDCTNCGLCELICPEFAIRVIPLEGKTVYA